MNKMEDTKTIFKLDNANAFRRRRQAQIKWMMLIVILGVIALAYLMYNPKKPKPVLGSGAKKLPVKQPEKINLVADDDLDNDLDDYDYGATTYSDYFDDYDSIDNWQDEYGRPHYRQWDYDDYTSTPGVANERNDGDNKDDKTVADQSKITKPEQPVETKQIAASDGQPASKSVILSKIVPLSDIYKMTDPLLINVSNIKFVNNYVNPCLKPSEDELQCFPSFFIVGMPHSGTEDLYNRLSEHPHIIKSEKNAPEWWRFFQDKPSLQTYLQHFTEPSQNLKSLADSEEKDGTIDHKSLLFEYNPNIFWKGSLDKSGRFRTPANLKHVLPHSKILLFVRSPVDRFYSEFMSFNPKATTEEFHVAVKKQIEAFKNCKKQQQVNECVHRDLEDDTKPHLEVGMYSVFYEEWVKYMSPNQIKVISVEEYGKDTSKWIRTILAFLEVPLVSDDILKKIADEETKTVRHLERPEMKEATREILNDFYKPYNEKLVELLNDKKFKYS